ncbi:MAG: zinc-ribbon domain-containing protein [Candidatus Nitrosopumilus sp. bin_6a]
MESPDIVDDVNSLLKLGVGDPYRLEHIKQTYIQNRKIWITDENYLKGLKEKYLVKHTSDVSSDEPIVFENEPVDEEIIHCWKCGKKCPLGANFCMICGSSLFEVGSNKQSMVEESVSSNFKKLIPLKMLILVGIPVLILIIFATAYSQGYFDSSLESSSDTISSIENEEIFYGVYDSKCGDGTVLDPDTNACVPGLVLDAIDSGDSKCGPGTIFDDESNSCVLR